MGHLQATGIIIQVVRVCSLGRLMFARVEKYYSATSHVTRDWYVTGFQWYYKRDWISISASYYSNYFSYSNYSDFTCVLWLCGENLLHPIEVHFQVTLPTCCDSEKVTLPSKVTLIYNSGARII